MIQADLNIILPEVYPVALCDAGSGWCGLFWKR